MKAFSAELKSVSFWGAHSLSKKLLFWPLTCATGSLTWIKTFDETRTSPFEVYFGLHSLDMTCFCGGGFVLCRESVNSHPVLTGHYQRVWWPAYLWCEWHHTDCNNKSLLQDIIIKKNNHIVFDVVSELYVHEWKTYLFVWWYSTHLRILYS